MSMLRFYLERDTKEQNIQWRIQGRPTKPEARRRQEGPNKISLRPPPPRLSQGLDDRAPSYLKVWIRH